jgi:uncharacterized RDD family membrane protein YckC
MNWFYAQNGQQAGPVDEGELDGLVQRGVITASTLVWHSGLPSWRAYAEARPAGVGLQVARPAATTPGMAAAVVNAGQQRCTECGLVFPEDEVVRLGNSIVCAGCKPRFLQKMREGISTAGTLPYAGFWIRFGATFFDGLIQMPVIVLVWVGAVFAFPEIFSQDSSTGTIISLLLQLFFMLFSATYEAYFLGRFGATPGKMICNLRVVRSDGSKLTYGRAIGRHFAKIISQMVLLLGYIMAAFDDQKRGLHDHICDTRVVYKS